MTMNKKRGKLIKDAARLYKLLKSGESIWFQKYFDGDDNSYFIFEAYDYSQFTFVDVMNDMHNHFLYEVVRDRPCS